jgi:type I restriction enzyme M protein
MANTQILAVVDMARELFQPKNDTQTSMVLARRLSAEERDAAQTGTLEYPIFMAIAERVGHDRRGNVLYRRTETGDDLMVTHSETVAEIDPGTGEEVLRLIEVQERQVDDDLPDVATAFRRWLGEQR